MSRNAKQFLCGYCKGSGLNGPEFTNKEEKDNQGRVYYTSSCSVEGFSSSGIGSSYESQSEAEVGAAAHFMALNGIDWK